MPPPTYNWSAQTPVFLKLQNFLFSSLQQLISGWFFKKICIYKGKAQEAYLWKSHNFVPADLEISDPKI